MDYIAVSMAPRGWCRSSHRDRRLDGNSKWQRNVGIKSLVDDDLHRHALNDLDEVAGGVLGREGGELRTRAELDAVDMPFEAQMRIGIDPDADMLAGPHVDELVF